MIAIPAIAQEGPSSGLRPIDLRTDVTPVMSLLRLAFGAALDSDSRPLLQPGPALTQSNWGSLGSMLGRGMPAGFVWEEAGRIVGNVSVLTTSVPGRYLVANVAVHPNYRRRGIARRLMLQVQQSAQAHAGREILLQVDQQNASAIHLYASLGYEWLGAMTTWQVAHHLLQGLAAPDGQPSPDRVGRLRLRRLGSDEWRAAYELDRQVLPADLHWPQPVREDAYKQGLWRWVSNALAARQVETWVVADDDDHQLLALGSLTSEWGRAHSLALRVSPAEQGQVERPLLARLIRRIQLAARRPVRMDHPAGDDLTNALLQEANFRPHRTLAVMKQEL